jgi:nitrate/TMAO reductase-like tetraheme cytochrome c subunit
MRHWVSAVGVALATVAAISFLAVLAMDLAGLELGNYTGIISYLILPAIFVVGLVLIPIGLRLSRKRYEKGGQPTAFPVLNFNDPRLRSVGLLVVVLTVVNLMIVSTATFKGVQVMDTNAFCGETCHSVMQPEAVAHQTTTHSNVACVDCHIGEGAAHYAKAKMGGARMMLKYISGSVSRPAPEPTEVPTEICTRCHATERFTEDRLHIRRKFSDKEKAVESFTILRTLIGGVRNGKWQGIHQHNGMKIRYLADPKRRTITDIEVIRADGSTDRFTAKDVKAPVGAQWYEMGCTDCHSRPAHQLSTPERVVDGDLARGAIDKNLPFIKREGLAVLKASDPSRD